MRLRLPVTFFRCTCRKEGVRRSQKMKRTRLVASEFLLALLLLSIPAESPVVKDKLPESGLLDPLQKLLRNNLVGIDVHSIQRRHAPAMHGKRFHRWTVIAFIEWKSGLSRPRPAVYSNFQFRISVKCPAMAAAAAIMGLTRCVRPPRPCRPSKLRLLVEAQRSPG